MTQQTIDWSTRGQRRRMLENLVLPELEKLTPDSDRTIRASSLACKSLLTAVESFSNDGGGSWPSQARLAKQTGLSERQVRTAVKRLSHLGLLAVDCRKLPNGLTGNLYSIVWSEIAVFNATDRQSLPVPIGSQRHTDRQSASTDRQSASYRSEVTSSKPPMNHHEPPPTTGQVVDFEKSDSPAAVFVAAGVSRRSAESIAGDVTAEQAAQIVATWQDPRNRMSSPGAIVRRVQNGVWPVKWDVIEAATGERKRELDDAVRQKKQRKAREQIEYAIWNHGRKNGWSESAIQSAIEAKLAEIQAA